MTRRASVSYCLPRGHRNMVLSAVLFVDVNKGDVVCIDVLSNRYRCILFVVFDVTTSCFVLVIAT